MLEPIKHECGIAHIRLRKPLQYYIDKYGSATYAVNKLYVMMKKQSNRGQDGVGVANIKMGVDPGKRYISRYRTINSEPVEEIFGKIAKYKYFWRKIRLDKPSNIKSHLGKLSRGPSGAHTIAHAQYY